MASIVAEELGAGGDPERVAAGGGALRASPSVDEWLPEKHLARFVVEVVDGLDLRAMSGSFRGSGSASYHLAACSGERE